MKTSKSVLLLAFPFLLFSCGEKVKEAKQAYNILSNLQETAQNMEKTVEEAEKKRQERIAKGDTLAMHYKDLQKYLPENVSGYSAEGDPAGTSMNMSGMSYSMCEQTFVNDAGDQVKIALMDYNGAYQLYQGVLAVYSMSISIETDEEKMQSIQLSNEDIKGWEVLKKKDKKASVFFGISGRFYLSIEADNQEDTELIKSIAEDMDLKELSKF
ncbi:MAG: hypothetical protein IIA88_08810 [Bacteroidetes bacterium]|nr:hypothetical protein [Bacteroidota bacterium]